MVLGSAGAGRERRRPRAGQWLLHRHRGSCPRVQTLEGSEGVAAVEAIDPAQVTGRRVAAVDLLYQARDWEETRLALCEPLVDLRGQRRRGCERT